MKQSSFFINVSNIIILFLNVDKNHDEINRDANKSSKTMNDNVNEDDDEI